MAHTGLHSERGPLSGEHSGRSRDPIVKVHDLAWLEFEKPDLDRAALFSQAFGFMPVLRTPDEVHLRGTDSGSPCVLIRRSTRSRFTGLAFMATADGDVHRLARATNQSVIRLPPSLGGVGVDLRDPSGLRVRVVADTAELPALTTQQPQVLNTGHAVERANTPQRSAREPARVQRLGHVEPMSATGLAQWGPRATKDFLGIGRPREALSELRDIADALREHNEFDFHRLRGLLKVATS